MAGHGVQLVCFDLGRVLVRLCDSWEQACREADPPVASLRDTERAIESLGHIAPDYELGRLGCDAFFAQVADATGLASDRVRAAWRAYIRGPYTGAEALLDRLRRAGVHTACLSNTNACHWRVMHGQEGRGRCPMDRFDFRFASHLIGRAKPDPAIYKHVERKAGVEPEHIVFFDDLAPNVEAARARGWRTFRITPDRHPPDQIAQALASLGVL